MYVYVLYVVDSSWYKHQALPIYLPPYPSVNERTSHPKLLLVAYRKSIIQYRVLSYGGGCVLGSASYCTAEVGKDSSGYQSKEGT